MSSFLSIFVIGAVLIPMILFTRHLHKGSKRKLNGIENGSYKKFEATIVDVGEKSSRRNGYRHVARIAIVEYVDNGEVKKAEFRAPVSLSDIGSKINIYVNEAENDLTTDLGLKYATLLYHVAVTILSIVGIIFIGALIF